MTPTQLYSSISEKQDLYLVDVREAYELDICKMDNVTHIPLQAIPGSIEMLPKDRDLVMICHHGVRSAMAVQFLKNQGLSRVFNLDGGIDRWAVEVDSQMARY